MEHVGQEKNNNGKSKMEEEDARLKSQAPRRQVINLDSSAIHQSRTSHGHSRPSSALIFLSQHDHHDHGVPAPS